MTKKNKNRKKQTSNTNHKTNDDAIFRNKIQQATVVEYLNDKTSLILLWSFLYLLFIFLIFNVSTGLSFERYIKSFNTTDWLGSLTVVLFGPITTITVYPCYFAYNKAMSNYRKKSCLWISIVLRFIFFGVALITFQKVVVACLDNWESITAWTAFSLYYILVYLMFYINNFLEMIGKSLKAVDTDNFIKISLAFVAGIFTIIVAFIKK